MSKLTDAVEEWRPIPSTDGWYDVSSAGLVRSWRTRGTNPSRRSEPTLMSPTLSGGGRYLAMCLTVGSRHKTGRVHALMLEAFVGPRPPGMQVRHLDGNKFNNTIENLAYGTALENAADKNAHGTASRGATHPRAVLQEAQVLGIVESAAEGSLSLRDIAEKWQTTPELVSTILNGLSWGWLTGIESHRGARSAA